jgi:hypothetical protein
MSLIRQLTQTPEGERLYQQERTILEMTELICKLMQEKDVAKKDLAERLGKSKSFITQLLSGSRNMTVRTLSDVLWALDSRIHADAEPIPREADDCGTAASPISYGVTNGSSTYTIATLAAGEVLVDRASMVVAAELGQHRSKSSEEVVATEELIVGNSPWHLAS